MPVLAPTIDDIWTSSDNSPHHLEVAPTQYPEVFAIRDTSAGSASGDGGERVVFATRRQTEAALRQMEQLGRNGHRGDGNR